MQRVAARQPAQGQPATSHHAIAVDCLVRIVRAARFVSAGGRQRSRNASLVAPDSQKGHSLHDVRAPAFVKTNSTSLLRAAKLAPRAEGRATSIRSQPEPTGIDLMISRRRRRTRFRVTAFPTDAPVAKPNLAVGRFVLRERRVNNSPRCARPRRYTAAISRRCLSRCSRRVPNEPPGAVIQSRSACGPSCGGLGAPCGLPRCSCALESHACASSAGAWADRCASAQSSLLSRLGSQYRNLNLLGQRTPAPARRCRHDAHQSDICCSTEIIEGNKRYSALSLVTSA